MRQPVPRRKSLFLADNREECHEKSHEPTAISLSLSLRFLRERGFDVKEATEGGVQGATESKEAKPAKEDQGDRD